MHKIDRLLINICSDKLQENKDFYTTLFDFNVDFEGDWFIHLISKDKKLELGIIDKESDLVPSAFQQNPNGFYLTFVVSDTDVVFETAKEKSLEIIEEPNDTFYGQRRMLLKDPDGTLVDVSSPIPNFEF